MWEGVSAGEQWKLEIEVDCFGRGEPWVASVYIEQQVPGEKRADSLAFLSASQAREAAAELIACAETLERHEAAA